MPKIDEQAMIQLLTNPFNQPDLDTFIHQNGVDATDRDGRTFLSSAVTKYNTKLVQYLLEQNYDSNTQDNQGLTPLHLAAIHDLADIAQMLLYHGAKIDPTDSWGNTPLWRAAMSSNEQPSAAAILLLERGADKTKQNHSGVAPMDLL